MFQITLLLHPSFPIATDCCTLFLQLCGSLLLQRTFGLKNKLEEFTVPCINGTESKVLGPVLQ
jgi:hypothetical protein